MEVTPRYKLLTWLTLLSLLPQFKPAFIYDMAILLYGILSKILEWMEWSGLDTPQTVKTTRATAVLKIWVVKILSWIYFHNYE